MTVSLWNRRAAREDIHTQALVIGAGIVGIACALELQRRDVPTIVIERHAPGAGASTRNAGYLMRGAADNYAYACDTLGRERTRTLWRWTEENLAILRAWGIESLSTYKATPSCLVALDDHEADELTRSAHLMREDAFETHILDSHHDILWRHPHTRLALVNPHDATINPRELIDTLAARLETTIITDCPAYEVHFDQSDRILVVTPTRRFYTRHLLICTNAWTGLLLPNLAPRIVPNRGQMLALHAPDTPALSFAYYLNRGGEYLRRADNNTIIIGGWRRFFEDQERTLNDQTTENLQHALESFAFEMLGARFPVTARWCGHMAFTSDGIPIVEQLPQSPHAVVCAGFTGHGMSLGARTARAAVELLLDNSPYPLTPR